MTTYRFSAYLSGIAVISDHDADRLYEAGCDDGTPFSCNGEAAVGFSREAATLDAAIRSAASDLQRAGYSVERIELERDEVEGLISAAVTQGN